MSEKANQKTVNPMKSAAAQHIRDALEGGNQDNAVRHFLL